MQCNKVSYQWVHARFNGKAGLIKTSEVNCLLTPRKRGRNAVGGKMNKVSGILDRAYLIYRGKFKYRGVTLSKIGAKLFKIDMCVFSSAKEG